MGREGGREREEEGHRMMCWRQVHLHSLQTQHKPFLGVSVPAALAGRFTASLCVCVCVQKSRRDKLIVRNTMCKSRRLCEEKGSEKTAAMLHSIDNTPPPLQYFNLHCCLYPLSLSFFYFSPCLPALLWEPSAFPLLCWVLGCKRPLRGEGVNLSLHVSGHFLELSRLNKVKLVWTSKCFTHTRRHTNKR